MSAQAGTPLSFSRGLIGRAARHRVALVLLMVFLLAAPASSDDRNLLQTNVGANTDILIILDSSGSMNHEFTDTFMLPAYMDDFIYPEGTSTANGSKIGVAKSVLREVLGKATGVNWAFAYYRNPNQKFGVGDIGPLGQANDGTSGPTDPLASPGVLSNGGLEWLYFAQDVDSTSPTDPGGNINDATAFPCSAGSCDYPDIQQGRFLQMGHKVMHLYDRENTAPLPEVADPRYPYNSPPIPGIPGQGGKPNPPAPGYFRGAFGPKGLNQGMVVYRNPNKSGWELRMTMITGNYGDTDIVVRVDEYMPPPTPTATPTRTNTPTATNTATATATVPSSTPTVTNTATAVPPTATFTNTNTPLPPTSTFTATRTFTRTNTRTQTNTPTPTRTATFTPTGPTPTFTNTSPPTNTPTRTNTRTVTRTSTPVTPTSTFTVTNTPVPPTVTSTPTQTNTPLPPTATFTRTNTRTATNTRTNTPVPTSTATPLPTFPSGQMPAPSLLSAATKWLSPALRGLLAMAPPPALPNPPYFPCPGLTTAPAPVNTLQCAPCTYDATRLCAFEEFPAGSGSIKARPLDVLYRGFDDPQADPDPTRVFNKTVYLHYVRGDQYNLPPQFPLFPNDPPWGSDPSVPDNDADGIADGTSIADRHNQGSYSAFYDTDRSRGLQQLPGDAWAEVSCPFPPVSNPCNVYVQDCGGYAHYGAFTPLGGSALAPAGPPGYNPYPGIYPQPPSPADWPVVPFPRTEWVGSDVPSTPAIQRLLRFTSSIVSYNSAAAHMSEYSLAEDARSVVATAPGTPIAGVLYEAYNYFKNSVFPQQDDPAINCRDYKILFLTDGLEECFGDPCAGAGLEPGNTNGGPSKDLGLIKLPEKPPASGARALAHSIDPTVPVDAIPVYIVAMGTNLSASNFTCIATNSSSVTDSTRKGRAFLATDRTTLINAIESIVPLKRSANSYAAPAIPAFARGGSFADAAQIGAVIPSHTNVDGSASIWSVWSGSLKSFHLDSNGKIPVVTGVASTPTPTVTPGGPTATPIAATPTITPTPAPGTNTFPDETLPDDPSALNRKPVWNAARVLGYTDPVTNLTDNQNLSGPFPPKAPRIQVWKGRRMIWASGTGPTVPLTRQDFLPNTGSCAGGGSAGQCFDMLMNAMGTLIAGPPPTSDPSRQTEAIQTVQFLRGGITLGTGTRDEVLNAVPIWAPVGTVGHNSGEHQEFSYFYQDDQPSPGNPQVRTDDDGNGVPDEADGYPHKLGDIFHSEPILLDVPGTFSYLSSNVTPRAGFPYSDFVTFHSKRRRVLFVGANDGFLHAFDAGVWNRDVGFPNSFDLGTGRELFAYAPKDMMTNVFPKLIQFPPVPQYFVDGSSGVGDVFIDTAHGGSPNPANRFWKSVIVGSLRQGGREVFALDVTQPDQIQTSGPNIGEKTHPKDFSPDCYSGGGNCGSPGPSDPYPTVLWEVSDACASLSSCATAAPRMGQTWSRPVVGRIKIINGASFEDRYVAIFGGGLDPSYATLGVIRTADQLCPPTCPAREATQGRAIYMVDIETGNILYKGSQGKDGSGTTINFAPMPAPAGVVDIDDDGYLDRVYIGDVNGRMWKLSLVPDMTSTPKVGELISGVLQGYSPFLLYDASTSCSQCNEPIFLEASVVFLSGGATPNLGVAFGTGNRADLQAQNPAVGRFFFVLDSGQAITAHEGDLRNITPSGGTTAPGVGSGAYTTGCVNNPSGPCYGFYLDYTGDVASGKNNEKATSSVASTQGFLTLVTFTPDKNNPCSPEGNSYRYRFFFLNGQGGYNVGSPTGDFNDYRQYLGTGVASPAQSTAPNGDTIDTILFSSGALNQQATPGVLRTNSVDWKEINQ